MGNSCLIHPSEYSDNSQKTLWILLIWENLSHNLPSHIGYTQKLCKCIREKIFYHMSDYCISDTIDGRTPRNCKTWRKPFRSHTILYNVAITQERNPTDKMNVRKFLSGAAITSYPKVHMKEKLYQYFGHPEMFLHQLDTTESTHRGWLQRLWQIQRLFQEVCFSECQIIKTGREPL